MEKINYNSWCPMCFTLSPVYLIFFVLLLNIDFTNFQKVKTTKNLIKIILHKSKLYFYTPFTISVSNASISDVNMVPYSSSSATSSSLSRWRRLAPATPHRDTAILSLCSRWNMRCDTDITVSSLPPCFFGGNE